jgi:hypothetical protein
MRVSKGIHCVYFFVCSFHLLLLCIGWLLGLPKATRDEFEDRHEGSYVIF